MAKVKITFFCQNCGTQYAKWQGQCNTCKSWNTIVEEVVQVPKKGDWKTSNISQSKCASKPLKISEIDSSQTPRLKTSDKELNSVLDELGGFERHWHVRRKKLLPVVRLFLGRLPWRRGK